MSAMDLLMQLDLPTVSDSSDTEDFLQELAAINDSGLLRATMESLECGRLTPLIKEELRCRIQSRRLSEGKEELFVEFPSPTPSQPRPDEVEKRDRRREQNRRAAQKFRKKKKERGAHLVEETQRLEGQNTTLRSEIRQLHEERDQLTRIIRSHASVCPLTPRHSPLTVVRESPLLVVPLRESPIIAGPACAGSSCNAMGGCQGLTLIRESPLTTADALKAQIRESPLPTEYNPRESPLTAGAQRHTIIDEPQRVAMSTPGNRKEYDNSISRKSPRLIRESPLLAALACLSSSQASGPMQCEHQTESHKNLSKSPVLGMTSGLSSVTLQGSAVVGGGGNDAADSGTSGRLSRNGRRSSLLMQSPVMGGARPSVVMQSPALLVPPTRESPVPLLIINPAGGATGRTGLGPSIGQISRTGATSMTSPLPPSSSAVPSSPVPMTSRPRKSPIALFRGNPSPVHLQQHQLNNPMEQRQAMDQSPILFGPAPKQSKHSIPPRLNLSGPKPVKPILPKPPSSLSSTSSTASSSSFPCSSPRTPQSFLTSPLPTTASPVSATGRPVHASPLFFGEGCFTPSVGKGLPSSGFINTGEPSVQQSNKISLAQKDDANVVRMSPMYDSDKLRQSPMQKPENFHQTNQSPLCILEAMRQINQSPMRKPDAKRKLTQSPLCTNESSKQHLSQSPTSQMETSSQASKSPANSQFNSPSRPDHSPMTVGDNSGKNILISTSRITQQSPVFFGSGKGSNPPPSTNKGQFLQPQPLPRSVSAQTKTPTSSLLTLLQRGSSLPTGSSKSIAPSSNSNRLDCTNTSDAFEGLRASNLFHSHRGSGIFSTTSNNTTTLNDTDNQSQLAVRQSGIDTNEFKNYISRNTTEGNEDKTSLSPDTSCSTSSCQLQDIQNASKNHEVIDVDELDEVVHRSKNSIVMGRGNYCNFGLTTNASTNSTNTNTKNIFNMDTTNVPGASNTLESFKCGANAVVPTFGNFNKHLPNAALDIANNDTPMKISDGPVAPTVQDHASSFNAGRVFPDSPALPSPSIMLDDNALSLEEIERSAAVLEGRDDFMDLLDIQALLELSADHASNNNGGNGNGNNSFSGCDNNVNPNSYVPSQDVNASQGEGQQIMSSACSINTPIPNVPITSFGGSQHRAPIASKIDATSSNNNSCVQHSAVSGFNSQAISQGNVMTGDPNFLFNIPTNSIPPDLDRYAQILASFRSPQNTNQNAIFTLNSQNQQSSIVTQQLTNIEQANNSSLGFPAAQNLLPNMGTTGNIFVSSATSTIHHHPSHVQQSSFLNPTQCPVNSFAENVNSALAPSALSTNQNFLIAPQTRAQQIGQTESGMMSNQNQSIIPLFPMGNQQHLNQSGLVQEGYRVSAQWRPPLPRSTSAMASGLNRTPEQQQQMQTAYSQSSDVSGSTCSNLNAQAPSGFSTYRSSRLRELLNAPTTPEVACGNTDASSASLRAAPVGNVPLPFSPSGSEHLGWDLQGNRLSASGGFNFNQRLKSPVVAATPGRDTGLDQSLIWDPVSSTSVSQGQIDISERPPKK